MQQAWRAAVAVLFGIWLVLAAGCGGGGGGGGGAAGDATAASAPQEGGGSAPQAPSTDATPQPPAGEPVAPAPVVSAPKLQLFIVDPMHASIVALADSSLSTESAAAPEVVVRVNGLPGPLAYDSERDLLYVGLRPLQPGPRTIAVFEHASALRSDSEPARSIVVPGDAIPWALQLDAGHDVLYLGVQTPGPGRLLVFEQASKASAATTPTRDMAVAAGLRNMAIDLRRSVLYVTSLGGTLLRYAGLETGTLEVSATFPQSGFSTGVALDVERDRLYVASGSTVGIVEDASAPGPALRTVATLPASFELVTAAFDASRDRLYVAGLQQAFVIDGASQLTPGKEAAALQVNLPRNFQPSAFAFP